jgi:hypothetical protein
MACSQFGEAGQWSDALPPSALHFLVEWIRIAGGVGWSDWFKIDFRHGASLGLSYPAKGRYDNGMQPPLRHTHPIVSLDLAKVNALVVNSMTFVNLSA